MTVRNALASVAVNDVNAASAWYEKLLGTPPSRPMPEVAEWQFERGGGLQVYQLPERAGSCSATLTVDDFDGELAKLKRLNINANTSASNDRVRIVMIKDPDGNSLAITQAIDSKLVQ
jgi:predicted enzyme related to lactoylglutathione lyase